MACRKQVTASKIIIVEQLIHVDMMILRWSSFDMPLGHNDMLLGQKMRKNLFQESVSQAKMISCLFLQLLSICKQHIFFRFMTGSFCGFPEFQ